MKVVREHLETIEDTYNQRIALIEKHQHNKVGRVTRPIIQWRFRDPTRVLIITADIGTGIDDVQSLATLLVMWTTVNKISRTAGH